jgi:hypothetical protein
MTIDVLGYVVGGFILGALAAPSALAQTPRLQFDPPRGFIGSQGWVDPQSFVDPMLEGGIDVYGFRPFRGSFRDSFSGTLFAERMRPEFSQPRVLTRTAIQPIAVPGADEGLILNFVAEENYYTYIHTRLAILARGAVAIVDVRARNADRVHANQAAVLAMLESLSVVSGPAPGAGGTATAAGNRSVAGLYVGVRSMWQGNPFGGVGSGTWRTTTYWYLLSPDGRVQRGYQAPATVNGNLATFDYERARREAPADGGFYRSEHGQVTFVMGLETAIGEITPDGHLAIAGTLYHKSR